MKVTTMQVNAGIDQVTLQANGLNPHSCEIIGTPDYAGPEVYEGKHIGKEYDWWSVGIIMFEMFFGAPPFADELHDPEVISTRVMQWQQHFYMPPDPQVGEKARNCIHGLICDPQDRLTADGIRAHPFFKTLNFKRLWDMRPPIKPKVKGRADTSNFDDFGSGIDVYFDASQVQANAANDASLSVFHDYDYHRDLESKKPEASILVQMASTFTSALFNCSKKMQVIQAGIQASLCSMTMTTALILRAKSRKHPNWRRSPMRIQHFSKRHSYSPLCLHVPWHSCLLHKQTERCLHQWSPN